MQYPTLVSILAFVAIAATAYARRNAARSGLKPDHEHWMVFGVFAATIAASGMRKQNVWVSLIALLLAVFGYVYITRVLRRASLARKSPSAEPDARANELHCQ